VSEYVKFACEARGAGTPLTRFAGFSELNACRRKLLQFRLLGVDFNGIGFGNLSIRSGITNNFYITGSGAAGIAQLKPADCAKVVSYDFERNRIGYEGSAIPSSESMTHAAVYESDGNAGAVIHCHSLRLWRALLREAPATSPTAEYGTSELALEVKRLFENTDVKRKRNLVMTGHEGGIITFGKDLEDAFAALARLWERGAGRV
jgi:L-ribulose-5-phosphate 4-epimerase